MTARRRVQATPEPIRRRDGSEVPAGWDDRSTLLLAIEVALNVGVPAGHDQVRDLRSLRDRLRSGDLRVIDRKRPR